MPGKGLLDPTYVGMRGARHRAGRCASTPNPLPGDPRPYETAGLAAGTRLAVAEPVTGPGETTTHFSVVDKWGNIVSYTNTIESSHGIGVFAGYTRDDGSFRNHGFLLNNELTDFNTTPTTNPFTGGAGYNDVQPDKRPRSSMAPTMIFTPARQADHRLRLARRLDDHQLGTQRHAEPDRPQDGAAGRHRCAAHVGHQRRQRDLS